MPILNVSANEKGSYVQKVVIHYYLSIFSIVNPFFALWNVPYFLYQTTKIKKTSCAKALVARSHFIFQLSSIVYFWSLFSALNLLSNFFMYDALSAYGMTFMLIIIVVFMIRMMNGVDAMYRGLAISSPLSLVSLGRENSL